MKSKKKPDGSERARDEQRGGGPRYGGRSWRVADERRGNRFGHARNDDANPSELVPSKAEPDRQIEMQGPMAGMGRGEKPRKNKYRQG